METFLSSSIHLRNDIIIINIKDIQISQICGILLFRLQALYTYTAHADT